MPLDGCIVQNAFKKTGKKYSIEIETNNRNLLVHADTQAEAEDWMSALTKASAFSKRQSLVKDKKVSNLWPL